ncbi:uncharacterized protein G2W53_013357 [Senna tora]|uniref:Uncharacterized protein n=1 Tax=Senna tora TaxID=362788 RepID=A0A834TZL6_9FABA|nr:uncharacterized protein G2W53_013357 [Senna tora]
MDPIFNTADIAKRIIPVASTKFWCCWKKLHSVRKKIVIISIQDHHLFRPVIVLVDHWTQNIPTFASKCIHRTLELLRPHHWTSSFISPVNSEVIPVPTLNMVPL